MAHNSSSFVALLMPPLVGSLSDRTSCKFGRRRPYIVAGGVLLVVGTPLLVMSSDLIIFLVGLSLLHLGMNTMLLAYQSLVPDHVPEQQRGEASGYVGALTILGNMVSLGLAAYLLGGINQGSYQPDLIRHNAGIYYEAGKHLGLWNASTTLPAIIAPLLGSSVINIAGGRGNIELGYRLVFASATFFLIMAAIGILFVREHH